MRSFIFLMALASSVGGMATDEIHSIVQCGGDEDYNVQILSGGLSGYLRAEIMDSLLGTSTTVAVKEIDHLDGLKYQDINTNGKVLQLTIEFNKRINGNMYKGYIRGNLNGEPIPPIGSPELGNLRCLIFTRE